jgi:hypothetical protein
LSGKEGGGGGKEQDETCVCVCVGEGLEGGGVSRNEGEM